MGLFNRAKRGNQTGADALAQAATDEQIAALEDGAGLAPGMPGMSELGNQDMAAAAAYSARVAKLARSGVEAPGVVHSVTATGTFDVSGAIIHAIEVTIRPEGGEPYETTIEQSLLPFELEGLSEGRACTVRYDPDNPTDAVLQRW